MTGENVVVVNRGTNVNRCRFIQARTRFTSLASGLILELARTKEFN